MRGTSWFRSGVVNALFQLLFLAAMYLFGRETVISATTPGRFPVLLILVGLPSLVWALFFYLQDRLEPEPASYVFLALLSGMSAAALFVNPLLEGLFRHQQWNHASMGLFIAGSFVLLGGVFSLVIFWILYAGFYSLDEFDEPVDGMVYGAIAACGFALVRVIHHLQTRPEATLFYLAYLVTTQVLIYSAAGSMIGFAFGQAKFFKRDLTLFSGVAVTVSALVIGSYHSLTELVFLEGYEHAFWISFGFAMVFAIFLLGFCRRQMHRMVTGKTRRRPLMRFRTLPAMAIYSALILLIATGVALSGQRGRLVQLEEWGVSFRHPHHLSRFSFAGMEDSLSARDGRFQMLFCSRVARAPGFLFMLEARVMPAERKAWLEIIENDRGIKESLLIGNVVVGGRPGHRIASSRLSSDLDSRYEFPCLSLRLQDVVSVGDRLFVFRYEADARDFYRGLPQYERILKTVEWCSTERNDHE